MGHCKKTARKFQSNLDRIAWRTTTTVRIWTHFRAQVALSWKPGITSPPDDLDSMIERLFEAVEACDFTDSEGDDVIGEMAESILNRNVSVLATQSLAPTAYRAVCQLNENGGIFARGHVISK